MRVEGVVFRVYEKTFSNRTNYSVKLEDDPLYYRLNQKRFPGIVEAGNRITFEANPNPDGKSANVTSDVTLATPTANVAQAPGVSGAAGNSGLQMRYQGALERAILFVDMAVKHEAIKLPTAVAKRLGVLEAAVDRYTAQYFEDTNVLGAVTREAEGSAGTSETPVSDEDDE